MIGPLFQKMSPIWGRDADGPTPAAARSGRWRRTRRRLASPADDQTHPAHRLVDPDLDRGRQVVLRVLAEEVGLERVLLRAGDTERALLGIDLGRRPQRDRHVRADAVAHDRQRHRLARPVAKHDQRAGAGDELVALSVDGDDRVARLEPGGGPRASSAGPRRT
jgi:hypothetical protein